jgi:beta-xylosidase
MHFRTLLFWLLLGTVLAGCTGTGGTAATPTGAPAASPVAEGTAAPTTIPTVDAATQFQNPILRANFPDPGMIEVDGTYYAYATNGASKNVQLARSTDLLRWEQLTDAMPSLPVWAQLGGGYVWAPEVMEIEGQYVLYYTARDKEADRQCIGVAVSDAPEGKFRDSNEQALICQVAEGGSIDASPFRDADGTLYLYWKNDGNCCSQATYIYVQELAPDGLSLVGDPTRLIRNDEPWEGRVVEAPTMWFQDGNYYLFYSGNDYAGFDYAVGYATCESPVGPCTDAPENPILASIRDSQPMVVGPGHQTIIRDAEGDTWLVYHVWEVNSAGIRTDRRFMAMDPLIWEAGVPRIVGPTTAPQPLP